MSKPRKLASGNCRSVGLSVCMHVPGVRERSIYLSMHIYFCACSTTSVRLSVRYYLVKRRGLRSHPVDGGGREELLGERKKKKQC